MFNNSRKFSQQKTKNITVKKKRENLSYKFINTFSQTDLNFFKLFYLASSANCCK